jgi:hypothetical protein
MIEILDNLFDPFINQYIVKGLSACEGWRISTDHLSYDSDKSFEKSENSDSGHVLLSYAVDQPDNTNWKLNAYADLILARVLEESKYQYKDISVMRYFWNYYSRSSSGLWHKDMFDPTGNFNSIVYYINDSDGGTTVGDQFVQHKQSRAIIFDSRELHKGAGPVDSKQRFALNILFQFNSKQEKAQNGQTNRICL